MRALRGALCSTTPLFWSALTTSPFRSVCGENASLFWWFYPATLQNKKEPILEWSAIVMPGVLWCQSLKLGLCYHGLTPRIMFLVENGFTRPFGTS